MEIEQALREMISRDPSVKTTVVLCCNAQASVPEEELASRGFRVSEIQRSDDVCFVYGDIVLSNVERLSDIAGIEIVSSAPEAEAF